MIQYLKDRRFLLIMLGAFIIVYAAVFYLYKLPLSSVLYAALLCAVIGLLFALADYLRYRRKHKALTQMKSGIGFSGEDLPEGDNAIEKDCLDLLHAAIEERRLLCARSEQEKAEIVDYFTLWAHQIKTPISAMHLILQDEDSEQSRELEAQLFVTEQYVEMVLAYLRMRSESTDYVLKQSRLDDIIRQAVRKYASMFIRKSIGLELLPITAEVLTDEKWLCFAVEQILSNAVKYTNNGSVHIYTEDETTLVIRDTGIGIAPEDLPRVCEKGFTGYNGRQDKRASGIGLYLTRQVLEKLGHGISIRSELGMGTTVRIDVSSRRVTPN